MIRCSRCLVDKDETVFYNDSRNRSGKQSQCKVCTNLPASGIKSAMYDFSLKSQLWREHAACKDQTSIFFPTTNLKLVNKEAVKICATCPVQVECLDFALETKPRDGTWAGLSPAALYEIRRLHPRNRNSHGNLIMYFGRHCRCLNCCRKIVRVCNS